PAPLHAAAAGAAPIAIAASASSPITSRRMHGRVERRLLARAGRAGLELELQVLAEEDLPEAAGDAPDLVVRDLQAYVGPEAVRAGPQRPAVDERVVGALAVGAVRRAVQPEVDDGHARHAVHQETGAVLLHLHAEAVDEAADADAAEAGDVAGGRDADVRLLRRAAPGRLGDRGGLGGAGRRGRARDPARRERRVVREGGRSAWRDVEGPAHARAVVDLGRALACVGEDLHRVDPRPDSAEDVLHIARARGDRVPLLDPRGRRVVGVQRAAGGLVGGVDEAVSGVGLLEVAVAGAPDRARQGSGAAVGHRHVGAVRLLAHDVGVGLGELHPCCARVDDRHDLERTAGRAAPVTGVWLTGVKAV